LLEKQNIFGLFFYFLKKLDGLENLNPMNKAQKVKVLLENVKLLGQEVLKCTESLGSDEEVNRMGLTSMFVYVSLLDVQFMLESFLEPFRHQKSSCRSC